MSTVATVRQNSGSNLKYKLEKNYCLTPAELSEIEGIIRDRHDELGNSRQKHIKA